MQGLPLGEGTRRITDYIRARIDPPGENRFLRADLEQVRELVHEDILLSIVEDL
ncbi:MAG: hypothetical protein AAGF35_11740 [Pseudomonadota bacterium]